MKNLKNLLVSSLVAAISGSLSVASAEKMVIGFIAKTDINPFFVSMKKGAIQKAKELGVELRTFSGRYDGDYQSQVSAIENLVAARAKGILITASDSVAVVPALQKARKEGVFVIALDTPLEPITAADGTFATNNFDAGTLIGKWAKAQLGSRTAQSKIALLDLIPAGITVNVQRNQGFLAGFGIDLNNPNIIGDETDPRIVGNHVTYGSEEGGQKAMENLLQKDPDIDVVYSFNELAAEGAYRTLKLFGKEKEVMIISVDGSCPAVQNVKDGKFGAISMQFPLVMAAKGVQAVYDYVHHGKRPKNTPGSPFFDTGVELVTDTKVQGLPSISSSEGLKKCWG